MTTLPTSLLERPWAESQSDLVTGLCRPEAYADAPEKITHLQTHISHVLLAGSLAYKIKKPLDLEFLDYSSLAKRRFACEEEVRINRRLAPALYLGVAPITGTPTQPVVDGVGAPIEYAVKMRAFAQEDQLDAMLFRGALTSRITDEIAHRLADFHQSLPPAELASGHGSAEQIQQQALQNFQQIMPLAQEAAWLDALAALRQWTLEQGEHLQGLFETRRREGYVRECHGDLHLGNIAVYQDAVQMFDAIEFNDSLRWIDVMSEVAFLVMDLDLRRRQDLAFRFLNVYLERTGDYHGAAVLRFYLVYRALVRAKVLLLRALQRDLAPRQRDQMRKDSYRHIKWAQSTIQTRKPVLVLLHGFSGSGKTSRSMTIVECLGAIRVRSDVERKRLHGMDALTRADHPVGQGLYDSAATEATYARLQELAETILRARYPVIVDAAFLMRSQRDASAGMARGLGIPMVIADFVADAMVLRERIAVRAAGNRDASDADDKVLDHQLIHAEPLGDDEADHVVTFDTERMDKGAVRELALHLAGYARIGSGASTPDMP